LIFINPGRASGRETAVDHQEKTMKILIAADGSDYTKRMLAYLAAHDEWLGAKHEYTVIHVVLAVPHRAAAFVGASVVREFYESMPRPSFGRSGPSSPNNVSRRGSFTPWAMPPSRSPNSPRKASSISS
jgi:hypothetical protein